jgi:hypothetical protein
LGPLITRIRMRAGYFEALLQFAIRNSQFAIGRTLLA